MTPQIHRVVAPTAHLETVRSGGRLACRGAGASRPADSARSWKRLWNWQSEPGGGTHALYGRRDARRYFASPTAPGCAIVVLATVFQIALGAAAAEPFIESKDLPRVPPTAPDKVLGTFQVKPGFKLELAAAEPLVMDPIAMSFDENGRLFVVEMRDYSERRDEHLGRIRVLEDTDGDGRFDKSGVYAQNLAWPTAVICYGGGIFVGASPDIWYLKDTDGDGVADHREVVFTGFGAGVERLNVQALLNSFAWGLDNRIHGASGGNGGTITSPKNPNRPPLELRRRDFSFDPRTLEIRPESGGGQYGLTFDDFGRKFVCSNSAHMQMLMFDDWSAGRNPFFAMPSPLVNIAEDGPAAPVYRLSPDEPWRVIRTKWRVSGLVPGPIEGGGRPSGYFTAATGITIYRGNAWPKEYRGDAFVADCGSNLIHRKKLFRDGVGWTARRPDDELKTEFIASTDNWFRPVQFANAPDGTLYVADMYREIIEHPWSLPEPMKRLLDLNSGNDRGRIYRVAPDGFKQPPLPRLGSVSAAGLVLVLAHENGWHRDTAARLLFERQDRSVIPALEHMLEEPAPAQGRLHALYALDGLRALAPRHLIEKLSDRDAGVREHAVRLSRQFLTNSDSLPGGLWVTLQSRATDSDPRVRYQLAFVLGEVKHPNKVTAMSVLARRDLDNPWLRSAILSSLGDGARDLFGTLAGDSATASASKSQFLASEAGQEFLANVVRIIAAQKDNEGLPQVLELLSLRGDQSWVFRLAGALAEGLRLSRSTPSDWGTANAKAFQSLVRKALLTLSERQAPDSRRVYAVKLAGAAEWSEAGPALLSALSPGESPPVLAAAIQTIGSFDNAEASRGLIEKWPSLTPQLRSQVLATLLARRISVRALLGAIRDNAITRSEFSPAQIQFLTSHRDSQIREQAIALFKSVQLQPREEVVQQFLTALKLSGDAARGKKTYLERCFSCHRVAREGHAVGPDFASVKSGGKEKLLVSILDPNREVAPAYLNYLVETNDGESLMGLIAAENATSVTLRRAFGEESTILRSDIRRIQSQRLSIMPEELEAALTPQDVADLLEFIVTEP
ncbi:MAG: c-type cytochrome [Verrucomicrobia bacterium]|nr:c-type cytochrome [Verrucomicrobiota bacterium]